MNFCYRNDSCNSKIWELGTHENKGIPFLKQKNFKEYHSCVTNGGSGGIVPSVVSSPDVSDVGCQISYVFIIGRSVRV